MIGQSLVDAFGKDLKKSFGSMPGSTGKGAGVFGNVAKAAGIDSSGPYTFPPLISCSKKEPSASPTLVKVTPVAPS